MLSAKARLNKTTTQHANVVARRYHEMPATICDYRVTNIYENNASVASRRRRRVTNIQKYSESM